MKIDFWLLQFLPFKIIDMKDRKVKPQLLLSSLWIFILFNMLLRDMHQFLNPQFMDQLMIQNVPEHLVLIFGFILEIPILMIPLSLILKDKTNTWANVFASCITLIGIAYSLTMADMDDTFFAIIELIAIGFILRTAFQLTSLPGKKKQNNYHLIRLHEKVFKKYITVKSSHSITYSFAYRLRNKLGTKPQRPKYQKMGKARKKGRHY